MSENYENPYIEVKEKPFTPPLQMKSFLCAIWNQPGRKAKSKTTA